MSAEQLRRITRELSVYERVAITMRGLVAGTGEDPLIRATIPRPDRACFYELMDFAEVVLIRLRPMSGLLETYMTLAEKELRGLQVQRAWADERMRSRRAKGGRVGGLGSRDDGPTIADLHALAAMSASEFMELDFTAEDRAMRVSIADLVATLRFAWDLLLALEAAVPVIARRLNDHDIAEDMLGERLPPIRERLARCISAAVDLIGPFEIEGNDEARRALPGLLG
jgi:hypothetical protein